MALEGLPGLNATDWYGWAAQTDRLAREPQYNPLREVSREKLYMQRAEGQTVTPGSEVTMMSTDGPGCVESLWMAVGGSASTTLDARVRVYYDGSSTPAIDADLGALLAIHFSASGPWHMTPHVHVEYDPVGAGLGFMLLFPMPFGTSIRVTYYNLPSSTANAAVYWMVTYKLYDTDRADGWRLRKQGAAFPGPTVTAAQTSTRMTTTGGPGAVIWHGYVGGYNATNLSWMERNFVIRTDGETLSNAVVRATGTEDWFDSAWYFQGGANFQAGLYSYVGTDKPAGADRQFVVGMATDFLGKWGGVPFESSADLFMDTEAACTTTQTFADCILYYSVA